jgi:copper(I)-binding protein
VTDLRTPFRRCFAALGVCAFLVATNANAILVVSQPWVRVSSDQRSAEAYMALTSTDGAVLVGATTFAAAAIAIKSPGSPANVRIEIALPANVAVQLSPAAKHFVLTRLTKPLKLGDRVPLSLTIKSADGSVQELLVNAEVRRHSAIDDELNPHKH